MEERKTDKKFGTFIRSDGGKVSEEGARRLFEGGHKGHRLWEESVKRQIGNWYRVVKPLDKDAIDIIKTVKGMVPRAIFLSSAIVKEYDRRKKEGIANG